MILLSLGIAVNFIGVLLDGVFGSPASSLPHFLGLPFWPSATVGQDGRSHRVPRGIVWGP